MGAMMIFGICITDGTVQYLRQRGDPCNSSSCLFSGDIRSIAAFTIMSTLRLDGVISYNLDKQEDNLFSFPGCCAMNKPKITLLTANTRAVSAHRLSE